MKKILLGLSLSALLGIGSSLTIPEKAQCTNCGLDDVCTSDFSCGGLGCPPMQCVKPNPYAYQGFCRGK